MEDTHELNDTFSGGLLQAIGFVRLLQSDGVQGSVRMLFDGRPEFTHSHGTIVQGGILTAWMDHAMARAVAARDPSVVVATLEIKTSFLARVGPGPSVVAAQILKWGRTVAFLEAQVMDESGRVLAKATSCGMVSGGRAKAA